MRERNTPMTAFSERAVRALHRPKRDENTSSSLGHRLARGLGWFSLALGLTETLAPRAVARAIGVRDRRLTLMALGAREIASGIGILSGSKTTPWVWARVGGDLMDLALLGMASPTRGRHKRELATKIALARGVVAGAMALDTVAAVWLTGAAVRRSRVLRRVQHGQATITIGAPVEQVYAFFRDFENLPKFMAHLVSVSKIDDKRSFWRAKAPGGATVAWEATILEDRPCEFIAWRSREGADIDNSGTVRFVPAPGDRGTEIHVSLRYHAPGGKLGVALAKLFGEEPTMQIRGDLRRLKQVIETGEVVHSDASIHRGMHAARPVERPSDTQEERQESMP